MREDVYGCVCMFKDGLNKLSWQGEKRLSMFDDFTQTSNGKFLKPVSLYNLTFKPIYLNF